MMLLSSRRYIAAILLSSFAIASAAPVHGAQPATLAVVISPVLVEAKSPFNFTGVDKKPAIDNDIKSTANSRRQELISALSNIGYYQVCAAFPGDATLPGMTSDCTLADAKFILRPTVNPLGYMIVSILDASNSTKASSDVHLGFVENSLNAVLIDNAFGTPTRTASGDLTLAPPPASSFQQFIQVIPVGSDAPAYINDITNMLGQRGVVAVQSQITGTTFTPGSTDASACNAGQQYLVYSVNLTKDPKTLTGFTRVGAFATGFLYDCANEFTLNGLAGSDKRGVPTLTNTIASYAQILTAMMLFKRSPWVPQATAAFPLAATFLSVDPDNTDVKHRVGEITLQRFVDNLCTSAATDYAGFPANAPTGIDRFQTNGNASQGNISSPGGFRAALEAFQAASGGQQAAAASDLNLNLVTGPVPYHVDCGTTHALHTSDS